MDKIKIKGISFVEQSHILVKYWYWGELELSLGVAFVFVFCILYFGDTVWWYWPIVTPENCPGGREGTRVPASRSRAIHVRMRSLVVVAGDKWQAWPRGHAPHIHLNTWLKQKIIELKLGIKDTIDVEKLVLEWILAIQPHYCLVKFKENTSA